MKLSEGNRINGRLLVERRYRGFNEQVNNSILFFCLFVCFVLLFFFFFFSFRRCRKENLSSHYTQNFHLNSVSNYV